MHEQKWKNKMHEQKINTKLHEQKHNESMLADITGAFFSTSVVIDANVQMSLCCSCG